MTTSDAHSAWARPDIFNSLCNQATKEKSRIRWLIKSAVSLIARAQRSLDLSINPPPPLPNSRPVDVTVRLPRLALLLCPSLAFATPALAIVNGTEAGNPQFQAVVSIGGGSCTGTFIHPRFILTAAHCIRECSSSTDTGCITGLHRDIGDGTAVGRDGKVSMTARDGVTPGSGGRFAIDFVYFPRATDLQRGRPTDNALLRTTTPFTGRVFPVLPHQDRPRPDESNYCRRWEFTWPFVLGFSTNANTVDARRRVGRAFAECDLELDETFFKLDGHGRAGQRGERGCDGDSGGPVLWPTGFGGFAVGGVHSASDNHRILTDTRCPSERGEGYEAFIPAAFLDRVAQTDAICAGSSGWEQCPGVPAPYGGFELRYRGTEIDQCGRDDLSISSVHGPVPVERGGAAFAEVDHSRFHWFCGGSQEATTAKDGVNFVIAKRGLTDRQIIWDTYTITGRPAPPPPPPTSQLTFSDTTIDFGRVRVGEAQSKVLVIRNSTGHPVNISARESAGTFSWDAFSVSLLNNTQREVAIEFAPRSGGNATGVLIVTSNSPGSPHRIKLRGVGLRGASPR